VRTAPTPLLRTPLLHLGLRVRACVRVAVRACSVVQADGTAPPEVLSSVPAGIEADAETADASAAGACRESPSRASAWRDSRSGSPPRSPLASLGLGPDEEETIFRVGFRPFKSVQEKQVTLREKRRKMAAESAVREQTAVVAFQHKVLGRHEKWITSETLGVYDTVPFHKRSVQAVGGIPRPGMFEMVTLMNRTPAHGKGRPTPQELSKLGYVPLKELVYPGIVQAVLDTDLAVPEAAVCGREFLLIASQGMFVASLGKGLIRDVPATFTFTSYLQRLPWADPDMRFELFERVYRLTCGPMPTVHDVEEYKMTSWREVDGVTMRQFCRFVALQALGTLEQRMFFVYKVCDKPRPF
jgi:hypothetical protein